MLTVKTVEGNPLVATIVEHLPFLFAVEQTVLALHIHEGRPAVFPNRFRYGNGKCLASPSGKGRLSSSQKKKLTDRLKKIVQREQQLQQYERSHQREAGQAPEAGPHREVGESTGVDPTQKIHA